jgi:hypothetical protein
LLSQHLRMLFWARLWKCCTVLHCLPWFKCVLYCIFFLIRNKEINKKVIFVHNTCCVHLFFLLKDMLISWIQRKSIKILQHIFWITFLFF